MSIPCNTLIPAQAVYDFNPNFGLQTGFSPKSGTPAATAVADSGIACNWLNQTSGDTFTFSVAKPNAAGLASLKASAAGGTAASGFGDLAYFSTDGTTGRLDVFSGAYWVSGVSAYFGSATDATSLMNTALGALE